VAAREEKVSLRGREEGAMNGPGTRVTGAGLGEGGFCRGKRRQGEGVESGAEPGNGLRGGGGGEGRGGRGRCFLRGGVNVGSKGGQGRGGMEGGGRELGVKGGGGNALGGGGGIEGGGGGLRGGSGWGGGRGTGFGGVPRDFCSWRLLYGGTTAPNVVPVIRIIWDILPSLRSGNCFP